jgi:hypothetical protein
MANEPLALAIRPPDAPNEDDFLALCAALSQSARGRAFLAEHTRRSRNADNEALLAAIGRIEARLQADASAAQRLCDDLRMLLTAIRFARPEIDAAAPAARAARFAKLLELFERRIEAMAEARPADAALRPGASSGARVLPDEPEPARAQLVVVPLPDEPELPIPSSAGFEPRPVPTPASAPVPAMIRVPRVELVTEVAFAEPASPATDIVEGAPAPLPDPLAALMALSEDERLALFT